MAETMEFKKLQGLSREQILTEVEPLLHGTTAGAKERIPAPGGLNWSPECLKLLDQEQKLTQEYDATPVTNMRKRLEIAAEIKTVVGELVSGRCGAPKQGLL